MTQSEFRFESEGESVEGAKDYKELHQPQRHGAHLRACFIKIPEEKDKKLAGGYNKG